MEMLKQMAGIDLNHVPYKGTGPALIAIIGGEVQVMFGGAISTVPQVKGGKLRAIAVAGDRRAKALPEFRPLPKQAFPGTKRTAGTASSRLPAHRAPSSTSSTPQ